MKVTVDKKSAGGLGALAFHVRAAAALGMWAGLDVVAKKRNRAPKALHRLTEQLINEAVGLGAGNENGPCRGCGCTDERACEGGCYWVAPGLCSRCADRLRDERTKRRQEARDAEFERIRARNDEHRAKRSRAGRAKR